MKRLAPLCLACLPGLAAAHPHVFVETGFDLLFDDAGRIEAIRVNWRYDELTSLYVTEERGVDADFDGTATEEELARLQGFDMDWPEGFEGDTYVTAGGHKVALGPPEAPAAGYENGVVHSTHLRRLAEPVDPDEGEVVISPYDPGYFSAYEITGETGIEGREGCEEELWVPDYEAASERLQAALEEVQGGAEAQGLDEAVFPPVGDLFAQEIRVKCDAGS